MPTKTSKPKVDTIEPEVYEAPAPVQVSKQREVYEAPARAQISKQREVFLRQRTLTWIMMIGLLVALSLGGYFYYKLHKLEENSNTVAQKEAKDLLSQVAKIYLIPTGEEPTVATVSDPLKLRDQAFFANAQKDDKVLMFSTAGKAVLYRPSINKIIETAPFNISKKDEATPPPQKSTAPLKDKTF